jgi:hypothetical protein
MFGMWPLDFRSGQAPLVSPSTSLRVNSNCSLNYILKIQNTELTILPGCGAV